MRSASRPRVAAKLAWAASLAVACLTAACEQPPEPRYREADLTTPEVLRRAAGSFWQRNNVPNLRVHDAKQVAILEFTVEFVAATLEAPPNQVPKDREEKLADVTRRLARLREKKVVFDPAFRTRLTNELFTIFKAELEKRTRQIMPVSVVASSNAYKELITVGSETVLIEYSEPTDPDIGYPSEVLAFPVRGLEIIKRARGRKQRISDVEINLLREVGADVAGRARIRVGVFRGKATIERGSKIWVLSRDVFGSMLVVKTLVSDRSVAAEDEFGVVFQDTYNVDSEKYLEVMQRLFPTFMALGFESTRAPPPTN